MQPSLGGLSVCFYSVISKRTWNTQAAHPKSASPAKLPGDPDYHCGAGPSESATSGCLGTAAPEPLFPTHSPHPASSTRLFSWLGRTLDGAQANLPVWKNHWFNLITV